MSIIFVACNGSSLSLSSWPVEVGWSTVGGGTESHLIRPLAGWTNWSAEAEAIHGVSLDYLREHGEPAEIVARRVADVVAARGVIAISAAAGRDQRWLDRLLQQVGVNQEWYVCEAERLNREILKRLLRLAPPPEDHLHDQGVKSLEEEGRKLLQSVQVAELGRDRIRDRAGPDSEGVRWIYREVQARVAARLAAARP